MVYYTLIKLRLNLVQDIYAYIGLGLHLNRVHATDLRTSG